MEAKVVATADLAPLEIKVLSGKNLPAADIGGKSDPYVRMCVKTPFSSELNKTQTAVIKNTLNPDWSQHDVQKWWKPFNDVHITGFKAGEMKLKFEAWDEDLTRDDFLGSLVLSVADILALQNGPKWFSLHDKEGKPAGELQLEFGGVDKLPK